jgi:hypothetical protein
LRDEDQIREAEVDGQSNDCGYEAGPYCADEVCDVAYEPDYEKGEGYAFSGGLAVVLNQLRNL